MYKPIPRKSHCYLTYQIPLHLEKGLSKRGNAPCGAEHRLGSKPAKIQSSTISKNLTLPESRHFPHRDGIIFERMRSILKVLNVEEVGDVGIGINK